MGISYSISAICAPFTSTYSDPTMESEKCHSCLIAVAPWCKVPQHSSPLGSKYSIARLVSMVTAIIRHLQGVTSSSWTLQQNAGPASVGCKL